MKSNQSSKTAFDPGEILTAWDAYDSYPHKRGILWFVVFCSVLFGGAVWAIAQNDWIMALTFFSSAAVYFWVHRNGTEVHHITACEEGFFVDQQFLPKQKIKGYFFVFNETVAVVYFELQGKPVRRIKIQMGEGKPEHFRVLFDLMKIPELPDRKEPLGDLWIRVLKL